MLDEYFEVFFFNYTIEVEYLNELRNAAGTEATHMINTEWA